jgi:hypothetical protein
MKKILLIAVALMLVPFAAMATMTAISDTDMAAVTGQAGVTLAPIDFSLDLNIKNIAYTDPDNGVLSVAGIPNLHTGGTFNIHDLQIVNLHETLNGTPIWTVASTGTAGHTLGNLSGIQAKAVEIDIVSFGDGLGGILVPLIELRNRTGVVISGPDARITIDEVKLEMTLDTVASGQGRVNVEWAHNADLYSGLMGIVDADGYVYTSNNALLAGLPNSFGDVSIQGIELILYAYPRVVMNNNGVIGAAVVGQATYAEYVAGSEQVTAAATAGLTKGMFGAGGSLALGDAFNSRHRAMLIISPH